jgi:predicted CopG family antitoxin
MKDLSIPTMKTQESIDLSISIYKEIPSIFQDLRKYSEDELDTPLGEGKRSAKGMLIHVLNCDWVVNEQIYLALLKKTPKVIRIHPERDFGKKIPLGNLSFSELVDYYALRRRILISILEDLKPKDWDRSIEQEGKARKETVYLLARGTAIHEYHHASVAKTMMHKMFDS